MNVSASKTVGLTGFQVLSTVHGAGLCHPVYAPEDSLPRKRLKGRCLSKPKAR